MKLHLIVRNACLLISIACLALAYALAGYPLAILALPVLMLFGILAGKKSAWWAAASLLALYIVLSAIAATLKTPLLLVVTGCTAALLAWDLNDFQQSIGAELIPIAMDILQRLRLRSLGMTCAISLLVGAVGTGLHLELSFGAIVFLALVATGCVLYITYSLSSAHAETEQHG